MDSTVLRSCLFVDWGMLGGLGDAHAMPWRLPLSLPGNVCPGLGHGARGTASGGPRVLGGHLSCSHHSGAFVYMHTCIGVHDFRVPMPVPFHLCASLSTSTVRVVITMGNNQHGCLLWIRHTATLYLLLSHISRNRWVKTNIVIFNMAAGLPCQLLPMLIITRTVARGWDETVDLPTFPIASSPAMQVMQLDIVLLCKRPKTAIFGLPLGHGCMRPSLPSVQIHAA